MVEAHGKIKAHNQCAMLGNWGGEVEEEQE